MSKAGSRLLPVTRSSVARVFLFCSALSAASLPAGAEIQHVIAISVDGLRADLLDSAVTSAPAEFPNFVRLRNSGASTFNARCDYEYSETVPNHITMITGRPASQPAGLPNTWHHGFTSNFPTSTNTIHANGNPAVPYKSSVFDVVHDRGFSTALYLSKTRLEILDRSFNATNGAPDTLGTDNGRDKIDFLRMQDGSTNTLVTELAAHIAGTLERFTFLHITDPDTAGHSMGWSLTVGTYRNALKSVDGYLGSIFTALDAKPALSGKVAILLTGDHGGGGGTTANAHTNATLPENYTVPFFVVAPGVPAGSNLYSLFENRFDPSTTRPTYAAPAQPIRNGDVANLSTFLLGLPPVPGAFMTPELKKPTLLESSGGTVSVSWPAYLSGWTLEQTTDLAGNVWGPVTAGITEEDGKFVYVVTPSSDRRFFRLRSPAAE